MHSYSAKRYDIPYYFLTTSTEQGNCKNLWPMYKNIAHSYFQPDTVIVHLHYTHKNQQASFDPCTCT
ncbi:hypothetical protein HOLleu_03686 [Holothuria leucospilota]|uniref:Uncharacterized protein n=1 Tax=Holothuria leucospilota TaxID=206669 RepID=A0A9Q1CTQ9_HOLLE|nr:hypothetical protein HOLleu_03686 [Holothuria leucospilota]